eukprot:1127722-Pleurochrysis_carterae.AAC.1
MHRRRHAAPRNGANAAGGDSRVTARGLHLSRRRHTQQRAASHQRCGYQRRDASSRVRRA